MEAMNVSLELSQETAESVAQAASRAGQDVPSFLQDFVQKSFSGYPGVRSLAEILAPFREQVEASKINDSDLDTVFNDARNRAAQAHRPSSK